MPEDSVVDKVAARISLDISPAQKALLQLSKDYQDAMKTMADADKNSAGSNIEQGTEQKRKLSAKQQEVLNQTQKDGELKRQIMSNLYYQAMIQMQQDYNLRMTQIEADNQAARDTLVQQSGLRTMSVMAESQAKIESGQKLSDQRIEQEQEAHLQKMTQNQQLFEERMAQLQARSASTSNGGSSNNGVLGSLGSRFLRDTEHYAVGTAAGITTFAILDQLSKIPQVIGDVSASMTKLKQVLEISPDYEKSPQKLTDDLKQLQGVAGIMAQAYGVDFATVLDTMSQAGRKFKDVKDIVIATDSALQLTAVDAVPAAQSIGAMEAIMSQFGLSTTGARQALYEITAAAHEFQTTGSDLTDAIMRSGSSFATMKMNTAESIAAIATLSQMTSQAGSTVGNAWKSIENSLGSDKSVKALKELGIQVYDAKGNLKDSVQILQDIQGVWPKLSDAAKQHYATVISGGKYQYGRLEAFLNDYGDTYQKALDAIKKANEDQQNELVKSAMDSIPKQFDATKASFQVMANTLATQVTPALIGVMVEIRNMDNSITNNIQSIDKLVKMGLTLVEAYAVWKVGALAYSGAMNIVTKAMDDFNTRLEIADANSAGTIGAFENMGNAALGMATKVGVAVGKMALLVGVVTMINGLVERFTNPDQFKIDDLQDQLNNLKILQNQPSDNSFGGALKTGAMNGLKIFGSSAKDFVTGHFGAAGKDIWNGLTLNPMKDQNSIGEKIKAVQGQLDAAKSKKAADDEAEMDKALKQEQDLIKKLAAGDTPGTTPGSSGTGGGTPPPDTTAAFVKPFQSEVTSMNENLRPYQNTLKDLGSILSSLTNQQTDFSNALKFGATQAAIASQASQNYKDRVSALKTEQDALHQTNDQIRTDMDKVASQLYALNPSGADVTTLTDGQQQAISALTNQYDQLNSQLDQNSTKWEEDQRNITSATLDYLNALVQLNDNGMKPLTDSIKTNGQELKAVQNNMNLLVNEISKFGEDTGKQSQVMADYNREVELLSSQNNLLHQSNLQLAADNEGYSQKIEDLKSQYEAGTITQEAYTAGVQLLNEKIQSNTDTMSQNSDQWYQNIDAIQSAIDKVNQMNFDNANNSIKDVIKNLKQMETDAIRPLDDQIKSIDEQLSNMQWQNQTDDNNAKLAKLQKEAAQWKDSTSAEGRKKYEDYLSQIADLQKTMSRDTARHDLETKKQGLEDQKSALQQHFSDLENIYNGFSDNVKSIDSTLQDTLRASAKETNKQIKSYLDQTIQSMQTLKSQMISTPAQSVDRSTEIALVKKHMDANSNEWLTATPDRQKELHDQNMMLGKSIGATYDPSGTWTFPKFAKGGQVPGYGGIDSVPAWVSPGEIVVPSFDDLMKTVHNHSNQSVVINMDGAFNGATFKDKATADYAVDKLGIMFERKTTSRLRSQGIRG